MALSGVYGLSISRDDLIRDAMLNLGLLGEGEIPTPSETVDVGRRLNLLMKQYQGNSDFAPGVKEWTRARGYLFLSNTTNQYLLGPNATGWADTYSMTTTSAALGLGATTVFLDSVAEITIGTNIGLSINRDLFWVKVTSVGSNFVVIDKSTSDVVDSGSIVYFYDFTAQYPVVIDNVSLRDNNRTDVALRMMAQKEYTALPSKADPLNISDPTAVYIEHHLGKVQLYTDCAKVVDTTKFLVVDYLRPTQLMTSTLDNPDYPEEWYLFLGWALSKEIATMFNAPWGQLHESNYTAAATIARSMYPDMSIYYFRPGDYR